MRLGMTEGALKRVVRTGALQKERTGPAHASRMKNFVEVKVAGGVRVDGVVAEAAGFSNAASLAGVSRSAGQTASLFVLKTQVVKGTGSVAVVCVMAVGTKISHSASN